MNKRTLVSLFTGVFVLVGSIVVTSALFFDVETNTSNTFTAGTLSMKVEGEQSTSFEHFSLTSLGLANQVKGGKTWTIENTGSVPGRLFFRVINLINMENGCNEAESAEDVSCQIPGYGKGELGQHLATKVVVDTKVDDGVPPTTLLIDTNFADANVEEFASQWRSNGGEVLILPGEAVSVTMTWSTDPEKYPNTIQGDSVQFGLEFVLAQLDTATQ